MPKKIILRRRSPAPTPMRGSAEDAPSSRASASTRALREKSSESCTPARVLLVMSTAEKASWLVETSAADRLLKNHPEVREVAVLAKHGAMGVIATWAESYGLKVSVREKGNLARVSAALVFDPPRFKKSVRALREKGVPTTCLLPASAKMDGRTYQEPPWKYWRRPRSLE